MREAIFVVCMTVGSAAFAQSTGTLSGTVSDRNTQEAIIGASVKIWSSDTLYTISDENGRFLLSLPVGRYNVEVQSMGYYSQTEYNVNIVSGATQILELALEEQSQTLSDVTVSATRTVRAANMTTPLSTQRLTAEEINVNPGGNFDVSKVIQVLPGVAGGTSANRNDIIVRGGGPSENVYYLDGIEIPVLNHFQTQGASGGATGILNVSFIQDVQLSSSAFDSRYDNALASTIVVKQRKADAQNLGGNIRLSGSEFAATLEGPLFGERTTFMASARRSYLQFLFKLLDLPIRPDYYDFQFKIDHKFNPKTELTLIGLGAIDNFKLEAPKDADATTEYITRANPLIQQWNYTMGASLKRLVDKGYVTIALSRNMFSNNADRYSNNALKTGPKLFSLASDEAENKMRLDVNKFVGGWKYSYGLSGQYVRYNAAVYNLIRQETTDGAGNVLEPELSSSSSSEIDFFKFGAFAQAAKYFFNDRLLLSGGLRSDMNTFTEEGLNGLKTLSPRAAVSFALHKNWNLNASWGSYYKIPPYTMLGFRDENGTLINKDLNYINAVHYTAGFEFIPRNDIRFTLEGFYKMYRNYPISTASGISYANLGTDFSAVGGEDYTAGGRGRVYGIEAYVQQKMVNRLFYVISATIYKSEFSGMDGRYSPSTWDYGYIFSTTFGYQFRKGWELGAKYRAAGGQPYTPFDMTASQANYLRTGTGTYNYALLNTERLRGFSQFDLRIDKRVNFKRSSLKFFVDIQNAFLYKTPSLPRYTFERNADNTGFATSDGAPLKSDGSNAIPVVLRQSSATVVPAIGFILDF